MPQKISNYFEEDHDRLDQLFRHFQKTKRTDFARAKEFFRDFKFGLQRHIIWEEEILFPLFEEKTGSASGGPAFVMRLEHREIGKSLEAIHVRVKNADPNSDQDEMALLDILAQHNLKEENILYPAIDRLVNDEEVKTVFAAMENIPQERYAHCCGEEIPVRS